MIQEHKVAKLIVHTVATKDCGEYSCEVTGGPTSKARLDVKGASLIMLALLAFLRLQISERNLSDAFRARDEVHP